MEGIKISKSYRSTQWNEAQTLTKRKSKLAPYAVEETTFRTFLSTRGSQWTLYSAKFDWKSNLARDLFLGSFLQVLLQWRQLKYWLERNLWPSQRLRLQTMFKAQVSEVKKISKSSTQCNTLLAQLQGKRKVWPKRKLWLSFIQLFWRNSAIHIHICICICNWRQL